MSRGRSGHGQCLALGCDECVEIRPRFRPQDEGAATVGFVPRVPRTSLPDGFFHIYCRGVAARPVFPDGDDRTAFLTFARHCECRYRWTCHAICVMSTHYHVVLESTRERLSQGVHRLNWLYATYFNARYGSFGHVFAERFSARVIEGEERVFETCAYVLLNPVKARLCERVEDWPWSYSRYGLAVT